MVSHQSLLKIVKMFGRGQTILSDNILVIVLEFLSEIRKEYYGNNQIKSEYLYVNGKKHGVWKRWYSNGQIKLKEYYHKGKMVM